MQVVRAIVHVTGHVYGDDESLSGKVKHVHAVVGAYMGQ